MEVNKVVEFEKADETVQPNKLNADGSVTVYLEYPVDADGETVTQMTFKRLRVEHLKELGAAPTLPLLVKIGGKVAGHRETTMNKLDAADAAVIAGVVGDFFERGRKIGKNV